MHTKQQKSMHTNSGEDAAEQRQSYDEVTEVMGNGELNDKQRLFCVLYTRCFNATKAYQKAYDVDYKTAASIAYRMMDNDGVKKEISRLKQNRLNREMLSEEDIVQMYIDILYADITDYVDAKHNMLNLSGPLADGRLIKKVSFGKTDSIELMDKGAALKWLSEHMDLATERQNRRGQGKNAAGTGQYIRHIRADPADRGRRGMRMTKEGVGCLSYLQSSVILY